MYSGSNFVLILISPVFILIMKLFLTWIRNLFVQHSEIFAFVQFFNANSTHVIYDKSHRIRRVVQYYNNFKFQNISSSCLSSPFITQLYNENM